jgi:RimJ/RimL family protein N-acetyltransferase
MRSHDVSAERALPRPFPERIVHTGKYVRLEPLSAQHLHDLWDATENAESSWTHLRYGPFPDIDSLRITIDELASRSHQPFWAVIDLQSGKAQGWLSICDIYPHESAAEIGSIWFSPRLQKSRASTESVFLLMAYIFDQLGYARLVWRCVDDNLPSRRAAERYGFTFEGIWRSGAVFKQVTRDIRWHSMLCGEWQDRRGAIQRWLHESNFDPSGRSIRSLSDC